MHIRRALRQSPNFAFENNLFYQRGLEYPGKFEKIYLSIRKAEERLYPDDIVRSLPSIPRGNPSAKEWKIRRRTAKNLVHYLKTSSGDQPIAILEVGCGNGWLCNCLATLPGSEVLGVDINETELKQAARVFDKENITFACADVLSKKIPVQTFDYIILAATIAYFSNLDTLIESLRPLLRSKGEIHILDSPVYTADRLELAKLRSEKHFTRYNSKLSEFYHYHSWDGFKNHRYELMHNPRLLHYRLLSLFYRFPPFPWVRLLKD